MIMIIEIQIKFNIQLTQIHSKVVYLKQQKHFIHTHPPTHTHTNSLSAMRASLNRLMHKQR